MENQTRIQTALVLIDFSMISRLLLLLLLRSPATLVSTASSTELAIEREKSLLTIWDPGWMGTSFKLWSSAFIPAGKHDDGKLGTPTLYSFT